MSVAFGTFRTVRQVAGLSLLLLFALDLPAQLSPQSIPPQFNFPAPANDINAWIERQDTDAIRGHAWTLWAAITSPSTVTVGPKVLPIWETWWSDQQVANGPQVAHMLSLAFKRKPSRPFSTPRQFGHIKGRAQLFSSGDNAAQIVAFNKFNADYAGFVWQPHKGPAGDSLSYWKCRDLVTLNSSWPASTPVGERKIADFSASAVGLKVVFTIVKNPSNIKPSTRNVFNNMTVLPLWVGDLKSGPENSYRPANPTPGTWKNCVLVDTTGQNAGKTFDAVPCNGHNINNVPAVSVESFYNFQLDQDDVQAIQASQGAGQAQVNDYAVLVAMHVTTKEIPNWTWQTFFWSNGQHPYGPPPVSIMSPWSNYETCTAYSMTTPSNDPNGSAVVCYNPYLETSPGIPQGIASNCMSCHATARFAVQTNQHVDANSGYPLSYAPNGFIQPNHANDNSFYFNDQTTADFAWFIGAAIAPPPGVSCSQNNLMALPLSLKRKLNLK